MKIIATIEARMTSSRLPGKVLLPAAGKPMLEHLVNRLKSVQSLSTIVLATTTNITDDVLVDFAKSQDIECFRGSEDDVMSRVINAARANSADVVVEITGDCPVVDPQIIEQAIQIFLANSAEYVSNVQVRSYPDGMDTQVFWLSALEKSAALTDDPLDREHVTLHIRNHPEIFSQLNIVAPPSCHWPGLGLVLDEIDDYKLLKKIIEHFATYNPLFGCSDIISLIKNQPELISINNHVKRKGDT